MAANTSAKLDALKTQVDQLVADLDAARAAGETASEGTRIRLTALAESAGGLLKGQETIQLQLRAAAQGLNQGTQAGFEAARIQLTAAATGLQQYLEGRFNALDQAVADSRRENRNFFDRLSSMIGVNPFVLIILVILIGVCAFCVGRHEFKEAKAEKTTTAVTYERDEDGMIVFDKKTGDPVVLQSVDKPANSQGKCVRIGVLYGVVVFSGLLLIAWVIIQVVNGFRARRQRRRP